MLAPFEKLRAYLLDYKTEPTTVPLRVAIFSSDAGFTTLDILHLQDELTKLGQPPFEICCFFSDNCDYYNYDNYYKGQSRYYAEMNHDLAKFDIRPLLQARGIPVFELDIDAFYQSRGWQSKRDPAIPKSERTALRNAYFDAVEQILSQHEEQTAPIDLVVNDTFLSIITGKTLDRRILNCHWGNLTEMEGSSRLYTGYHAFLHAMQNGATELYSTVHYVNEVIDGGQILLRSRPLKVDFQLATSYGFPFMDMSHKQIVDFLNDPKNRDTAISLESFFEALARLTLDSDSLSLAVLAVSKNFFTKGGLQEFLHNYGINDGNAQTSSYLTIV